MVTLLHRVRNMSVEAGLQMKKEKGEQVGNGELLASAGRLSGDVQWENEVIDLNLRQTREVCFWWGRAFNKQSIAMGLEANTQRDIMERNEKNPADLSPPKSMKG